MFNSSGPRGASFSIRLTFTGFVHHSQVYRVYETMPVRVLHYRIAFQVLLVDPRGLRLYVENRPLFHRGTISDRFDPRAPNVPTPFLVPNSVLEVRQVQIGNFGPAVFQPQFTFPGPGIESEDGEGHQSDFDPPLLDSEDFLDSSDTMGDLSEGPDESASTLADPVLSSLPPPEPSQANFYSCSCSEFRPNSSALQAKGPGRVVLCPREHYKFIR